MKTLILPTLFLCSSFMACVQDDRRDRDDDDEVIVIIDDKEKMTSDKDLPPASMDARCAMETCSGKGSCQIIGDRPICICQEGYRADGLTCQEAVAGDPRILEVSDPVVRLTQGESVTLVIEAVFDSEASATLRYIDPEEPEYTEDLYMLEHDGEGTFTLELSWEGFQQIYDGLYFDEEVGELLYIHLEDAEGRTTSEPLEVRFHCEGAGGAACDGQCVDLSSDREHCGRCHTPTPAGAQCRAGERQCDNPSLVACDEGCIPSNEQNCGRCGNTCYTGTCDEGGFCSDIEVFDSVAWEDLSEYIPPTMVDAGRTYMMQVLATSDISIPASPDQFVFLSSSSVTPNWVKETPPVWPAHQSIFRLELLADPASSKLELIYAATESSDSQGHAITHLYATTRQDVDSPWSQAVRVSEQALHIEPGIRRISLNGILRTHIDELGMHWLVHRSQRGFEVLSRADFDHPWQHVTHVDFTFVDGPRSYHFGHVYDVDERAHHLVFRDQTTLYHSIKKGSEPASREVIDVNLHYQLNEVSNLYLDDAGMIHLMYDRIDQLAYRTYSTHLSTWTQPELITPPSDRSYNVDFDPDPESFTLDKWGNKWILTHVGWHTVLIHQPAGTTLWTSRIVGALPGASFYYGMQTELAIGDNEGYPVVHTYHKSIATSPNREFWIYTRYTY